MPLGDDRPAGATSSTVARQQTQGGVDPIRATDEVCTLMQDLKRHLGDYQNGAAVNTSRASPIWQDALTQLLQIGQAFGFDPAPVLKAYGGST